MAIITRFLRARWWRLRNTLSNDDDPSLTASRCVAKRQRHSHAVVYRTAVLELTTRPLGIPQSAQCEVRLPSSARSHRPSIKLLAQAQRVQLCVRNPRKHNAQSSALPSQQHRRSGAWHVKPPASVARTCFRCRAGVRLAMALEHHELDVLYGAEAVEHVSNSSVRVVGAGGVGFELFKNLPIAAFPRVTVVDLDIYAHKKCLAILIGVGYVTIGGRLGGAKGGGRWGAPPLARNKMAMAVLASNGILRNEKRIYLVAEMAARADVDRRRWCLSWSAS
eukprot:TRINITY_DN1103_c0_g3_i1.p1 TRINITY_DN1103_c0_g3~~TRINITY_DN1103_c0_g3_i1.p1  ORF type:complete len:278 (+),score=29.56 TRINITY_DN1103_c0_g3_i1:2455-3288(+)